MLSIHKGSGYSRIRSHGYRCVSISSMGIARVCCKTNRIGINSEANRDRYV